MQLGKRRVLAVNPGSTSTKFAIYEDAAALFTALVRYSESDLAPYKARPIVEQAEFRLALIEAELQRRGIELSSLDAVAGRGGLLQPVASGTYRVNRTMLEELRMAKRGEHASNLG